MRFNILLLATILIISYSCDFDEDINVSPATPADVSAQAIIPAAQTGLAWVIGGELVRLSGLFTQQFEGINAQQGDNYRYLWRPSDGDGIWFRSYVSTLQSLVIVKEKAIEDNSNHTRAMADILIAHGIGSLTDLFGDIPYNEAFGAEIDVTQPTYDTQETIYDTIQSLLDNSITLLNGPAGDGPALDSEDLIYDGDLESWIAAAYSLKTKYYLRLSKRLGNQAYQDASLSLVNAIASNDQDLQLLFGDDPNESNPAYQFSQDRNGNIIIDTYFFELLNSLDDPRRSALLLPDTDDPSGFGRNFGQGSNIYYVNINSPVVMTSFTEMKFIQAEIELMLNNDVSAAEVALSEAITASIEKLTGDTDTTYVNIHSMLSTLSNNDERLEQIILQKYIAMYSNGIEPWTDYRRTGYPELIPVSNGINSFNLNGEIPRRVSYPQSE
ncbi:MAG: SusD/RagB family nutrient-binding outer membrane lipoprotein, partial [Bacteroidota bacterium]